MSERPRAFAKKTTSERNIVMENQFNTIEEAIDAFKQGEIIIVVDDEDRENEGDFICAAEKVTPEHVNFMLRYGRGQTCVPLLPETCRRLELPQMVQHNTARLGTAFTVPVDHVDAKTGITAPEKAMAIRALADPETKPTDFARPGHIFPLEAKEGGVLQIEFYSDEELKELSNLLHKEQDND